MLAPELWRLLVPLLRPRLSRLILAIALGALSLGSALGLAGVSAWLITRAWQMPPVFDLTIAVVAVRALGISRGVLGYCERLASHDTALRSAGNARSEIYRRLARGPAENATRLHSGELVARVGSDVDTLADVLVRALIPAGVAVVLGIAATSVIALISPAAALLLAVCLLVAGGLAPWFAGRAVRAQEEVARRLHADRDIAALTALDHAPELRVAGRLHELVAEAERKERDWGAAIDRAAAPAAVATAVPVAALAVAVMGAVFIGLDVADTTAPTTLAVLMLLPLSAFEAVGMLPAAAVALTRASIAATGLLNLAPPPLPTAPPAGVVVAPKTSAHLRSTELRAGYPGSIGQQPVSLDLAPGTRLAITGPSGVGKTSLLMTLAGLLSPISGVVRLGDDPIETLSEAEVRSRICYFAEDAHLFATTVRDNVLVARGDCTDAEITEALNQVGLGRWLAALPVGLDTVLVGGAAAVSGGQRRRLLLARILVCPAPIVVLDEPTEHLDPADANELMAALLDPNSDLATPERTVIVATHQQIGNVSTCQRLSIVGAGYPNCRSSV